MDGIIQYMVLCIWLLSLSSVFSRIIHVVACISTSFLFIAEYYSIVWLHHVLFIHSLLDGHLGCFYLWDIMNNAAMDILVQVFVWTFFFY